MSYAPKTLLDARVVIKQHTGLVDNALGIVGDRNHTYGYHLGKDRLPAGDYSARHPRDLAGLSDAASALDVGWFGRLVELTAYLVVRARAGRLPDVREIIGPGGDGRAYRWAAENRWRAQLRADGDSHETHTHISWYRDSQARDKTAVFRQFFDGSADTADAQVSVPSGSPALRLGSAGSAVRRLQAALNDTVDAGLVVDGQFGAGTLAAVRTLQKQARLVVDGIYGPATAAALRQEAGMPTVDQIWNSDGVVKAPSASPTMDTNPHWSPASIIRSNNDHARKTLAELRAAVAAQKKRDEAILAAVKGVDTQMILDRIDQRAAEDAARDQQLTDLVEQALTGQVDAAETIRTIAQILQSNPDQHTDPEDGS